MIHGTDSCTSDTRARPGARSLRLGLGLLLVVAGGFAVALLSSSPAEANQQVKIYMDCWSPHTDTVGICGAGSPDVLGGVDLTLHATMTSCDSVICTGGDTGFSSPIVFRYSKEGNGVVDHTSAVKPFTWYDNIWSLYGNDVSDSWTIPGGYTSTGARRPAVQLCTASLSRCTGWDKWDVAGVQYDLDVGTNTPPSADMHWWSPCKYIASCVVGSPDGTPQTFTLTAGWDDSDNYAGSRVTSVQWDWEGNGSVDQTDVFGPLNASSGTRSATHFYVEGVYQPQARFCDNGGGCGGWDKLDIIGINVDLDVVDDPPSATMEWWSPCYTTLGSCSGGSPDGRPSTVFTLTASGSDDVGVTQYEWDFDGNSTVDQTTTGNTVTHSFAAGVYQPQVRAVDVSNQRSGWDKKDIALINIDLDTVVTPPSATMNWWSPCKYILSCVVGSPDGVPGNYTLSAAYSDGDANLGGRVVQAQWDFDGNGSVDQTTSVTDTSGSGSVSLVHNYAEGVYQPAVRFVDNDGAVSGWDKNDILGINVDLDVVDDPPSVTMEWWSPCYETLGSCSGGSPDGRSNQNFALHASGSDDVGVTSYEWDFDGNGSVDQTTAGNSVAHNYGAIGVWQPQVRAVDGSNQRSGWDRKDIALVNIDLDTDGPSISVNMPNPCWGIYPACIHGSPDATTADVVQMSADYSDAFGVAVASVQWDFDGNGSVDASSPASGTSGTSSTTYQYGSPGAYTIKARAVGVDGAIGNWDDWSIIGIHADYDVNAAKVRAQMGCPSPHTSTVGIDCAGAPDVRQGSPVTLGADVDVCASACVGNYFTPSNINSYQIEWDLGNGSAHVIENVGGGADRTRTFPSGYAAKGAFRPQVRLCDNAATSANCTSWDRYDVALVEYDYDVGGPQADVGMPSPCWGIYPACIHGAPDATTADVVAMQMTWNDPFGVSVAHVDWDFNGDGTADATSAGGGASGSSTISHTYGSPGVYTIQARAVGTDGVAGDWDDWSIIGIHADYDVNATQVRAQMGCPTPHTSTVGIDCAGTPDVRQGAAVTLSADVDTCAALCVGNYFTPTDVNSYDIQWDLGDGSPTLIDHVSGGADRIHSLPGGYGATGAYRPAVRLCDNAATSANCTSWDRYDVALVEYDYDVAGPTADVGMPNPCWGIYPACIHGAPDATTANDVAMTMDYDDSFGVAVASVQWDFDGDGSVDATTPASGTSGTSTISHQYDAGGAYTIRARAIGTDGVVGAWDDWSILGLHADYDVASAGIRAQMGCPDPHTSTVLIDCAGTPDVRVNSPVLAKADLDVCATLCIGNYFEPTDVNDYDIEWRLGDGSPPVIDHISGSADRTHGFPSGYATAGAYRPEVRLCDDAATSTNCTSWDRYDVLGVEYDYDAEGPSTTVDMPEPCFGIYPACIHGAPDANTADTVTLHGSYDDSFGVAVDHVEIDADGDGSVDHTQPASGTSGSVAQSHQFATAGVYDIKMRAVGVDGAVGLWDDWSILGLHADYDVAAAKVRAQMGCPTPHTSTVGIQCAGTPDVRVGGAVTTNADIDTCSLGILCIGNYFTPSDINSYDIEWRLGDGTPSVVEHVGGGADRTHSFPSGYSVAGEYRPEVRLCDDAAGSVNCTDWDRYDVALVEYDYDVDGPTADVDNPEPCFGIYPACIHGSPDATTADMVTMHMHYDDSFGVAVDHVDWDFDGDGTVDATSSASGTSGSTTSTHQYLAAGAYTIKARAVGVDGAAGRWDDWSILGLHADFDVNSVRLRAQMGCWDPADATVFICGAGGKDVRDNAPITLSADVDSCGLGILCLGNYFTPTDQNSYDIEWRLNGPGVTTSAIDHVGGVTSPRTHLFPAGYTATGAYRPEVRLCDDAATSTNCSDWDKYDVVLVEYDLDVWAPCTGDADHDGVPCYFDPDNDTTTYNHQLNYVRQAAAPGVFLTNANPDLAIIAPLNMNRTSFFGTPIWTGGMNFIQADVINPNGVYVNLKWAHFGLWATTGIGSSSDTAYLRGLSFCLGAKPSSLFGYAFGFCTFQSSLDDDQKPLEIEDEVLYSSYIPGYGPTDYDGFTVPLLSPEIQVSVNP